jgi:hypothetical protein
MDVIKITRRMKCSTSGVWFEILEEKIILTVSHGNKYWFYLERIAGISFLRPSFRIYSARSNRYVNPLYSSVT